MTKNIILITWLLCLAFVAGAQSLKTLTVGDVFTAIDKLRKKNTTQQTSPGNTTVNTSSNSLPVNSGQYSVKGIDNGLDFAVTGCSGDAAAQKVTVYFTFANPRKVHQSVRVGGGGSTKAVDDEGNSISATLVSLANVNGNADGWSGGAITELISGGKIKGSVTFINVLPNKNTLPLINIYAENHNWEGGADAKQGIIEINNLPINWNATQPNVNTTKQDTTASGSPNNSPSFKGDKSTATSIRTIDNGINFNITDCIGDAASQRVTIYFAFANPNKVNQRISVIAYGGSKAIDDNGNEVKAKIVTLANKSNEGSAELELVYGGTVKGSITYINILPTVKQLSLADIVNSSSNWDGGDDSKNGIIEIKNLPINWKPIKTTK